MLLSHSALNRLIGGGVVSPGAATKVNGTSINLTLADEFLFPGNPRRQAPLNSSEVTLHPGEFVLARTSERFAMPTNLTGLVSLRSSSARIGLEHANAGWVDPGFHGCLTLEFYNHRPEQIVLIVGQSYVQIGFFEHDPVPPHMSYKYHGRFNSERIVETPDV